MASRLLRFGAFIAFVLAAGERLIVGQPAGALIAVGLACWVLANLLDWPSQHR